MVRTAIRLCQGETREGSTARRALIKEPSERDACCPSVRSGLFRPQPSTATGKSELARQGEDGTRSATVRDSVSESDVERTATNRRAAHLIASTDGSSRAWPFSTHDR
jgi:hypothetical protein